MLMINRFFIGENPHIRVNVSANIKNNPTPVKLYFEIIKLQSKLPLMVVKFPPMPDCFSSRNQVPNWYH